MSQARTNPPAPTRTTKKRGASPLATLVPDILAPMLSQRGFATSALMTEWREIIGPRLAEWTSPVEIRWPRKPEAEAPAKPLPRPARNRDDKVTRATLVIACPSAFALEVQMAESGIIEAVNRRLGFGCIGAVRIVQSPRPAPATKPAAKPLDPAMLSRLEASMANIADEDLRASLARFGAVIMAKK